MTVERAVERKTGGASVIRVNGRKIQGEHRPEDLARAIINRKAERSVSGATLAAKRARLDQLAARHD